MTDDDGAVLSVFGWCQSAPGAKPDQHHNLCDREYRSQFGVIRRCSCEAHKSDESPTVDRDSRPASGRIGAQSGPESALTDRGQTDYLGVDQ